MKAEAEIQTSAIATNSNCSRLAYDLSLGVRPCRSRRAKGCHTTKLQGGQTCFWKVRVEQLEEGASRAARRATDLLMEGTSRAARGTADLLMEGTSRGAEEFEKLCIVRLDRWICMKKSFIQKAMGLNS